MGTPDRSHWVTEVVLRCTQVTGRVYLTSRQGNQGACRKGADVRSRGSVLFLEAGWEDGRICLIPFILLKGLAHDSLAEASLMLLKAQVTSLFPQES